LYWSKTGDWFRVPVTLEGSSFVEGVPREAEPLRFVASTDGGFVSGKKGLFAKESPLDIDVVIVCCHGGPGEDGTLQGALDLAGIAYTGPDVAGAALGMDKLTFGGVVAAAGFPVLSRVLVTEQTEKIDFAGPYILKPRFGGSSIGIEVVDNVETAKALLRTSTHFRDGVVAEPYRPDSIDLNIGVRLFPQPQVSAIEKPVRSSSSNAILGYADKYVGGEGMVSAPRELPAAIDPLLTERIRTMAVDVARLVGVRGVQRLDFLADGNELYVNEINTIPGSLAKHLWVQPDVPFVELLEGMVAEAKARRSTNWTTVGADGTALRSAGKIAGKLG
jgi:D-alanine-D-alanine ligase